MSDQAWALKTTSLNCQTSLTAHKAVRLTVMFTFLFKYKYFIIQLPHTHRRDWHSVLSVVNFSGNAHATYTLNYKYFSPKLVIFHAIHHIKVISLWRLGNLWKSHIQKMWLCLLDRNYPDRDVWTFKLT